MPTTSGIYSVGTYQGCRHSPGFPTEASTACLPVLPAFDQSCQPPALALHSTFSLDRLDDTEGRIVRDGSIDLMADRHGVAQARRLSPCSTYSQPW